MNVKGRNMVDIKKINRGAILKLLYTQGDLSRKDIAAKVKLTPAAITMITTDMIAEGLLSEIREESNSFNIGRKEVIIDIKYNDFWVIGINIGIQSVGILCSNLKCEACFEETLDTSALQGSEAIINLTCERILYHLNKTPKVKRENIIGVGIGVRGVVDNKNGISLQSFGIWEKNVPVKEMFQQRLELPVTVDNNVRAMAHGETFLVNHDTSNSMLFIKYGSGIGSAMMINDQLYTGDHHRALEFGHVVVEPLGRYCRCGKRGCLETVASFDAIFSEIRTIYSDQVTPVLYELTNGCFDKITVNDLLKAYHRDERPVKEILTRAIQYFSMTICNTISLFDPQKIVLYGECFNNDEYMDLVKARVDQCGSYDNIHYDIEKSSLNLELDTKGPATLAIRRFLNRGGARE